MFLSFANSTTNKWIVAWYTVLNFNTLLFKLGPFDHITIYICGALNCGKMEHTSRYCIPFYYCFHCDEQNMVRSYFISWEGLIRQLTIYSFEILGSKFCCFYWICIPGSTIV